MVVARGEGELEVEIGAVFCCDWVLGRFEGCGSDCSSSDCLFFFFLSFFLKVVVSSGSGVSASSSDCVTTAADSERFSGSLIFARCSRRNRLASFRRRFSSFRFLRDSLDSSRLLASSAADPTGVVSAVETAVESGLDIDFAVFFFDFSNVSSLEEVDESMIPTAVSALVSAFDCLSPFSLAFRASVPSMKSFPWTRTPPLTKTIPPHFPIA